MNAIFFLLAMTHAMLVCSYLQRPDQWLVRKILQNKDLSPKMKKQANKVVCFHYIPLALKESCKFTKFYSIPRYLLPDYNQVAINGLIKGVNKYNWDEKHTNLSGYLRKYIVYELYHTLNKNATIYDSDLLEWKMSSPQNGQVATYYDMLRDDVLLAANRLSPYEKRLFFLVYDSETLQRTKNTVGDVCQLVGIDNAETYRRTLIVIVEKVKNYMRTADNIA